MLARIVHSSISRGSRARRGVIPCVPFWRIFEMSFLKQKLAIPVVKYSVLGLASGLWVFGLVDQFQSSASMMKYLLLSLLMAAVAFI